MHPSPSSSTGALQCVQDLSGARLHCVEVAERVRAKVHCNAVEPTDAQRNHVALALAGQCPPRVSSRVSSQCVLPVCPTRASSQSVVHGCPPRLSSQGVLPEGRPWAGVLPGCPPFGGVQIKLDLFAFLHKMVPGVLLEMVPRAANKVGLLLSFPKENGTRET